MKENSDDKEAIKEKLESLEKEMLGSDFWQDKDKAQGIIKEIASLKDELAGESKYDKGDAVVTIFAGAGGDDSEDWTRILFEMYFKFTERKNWHVRVLHKHENEVGNFKNITFEVEGKGGYGTLRNESGVHRLVRISPFSSKKLRHTSFALVEVTPKFVAPEEINLPEEEIRIELSRAGGAGGQNVNKRETAVRIVHVPTNIAVRVDSERSQHQNRQKAEELLKARLYKHRLGEQSKEKESMQASKSTDIEWGHQIRSYVFHPYQMVKDHRTGVEVSDVDSILDGKIEKFLEAEKDL